MIKQYKVDKVAELTKKLQDNSHFIFTDYKGLTVEEMQELKRKLRDLQVEYRVVKNTYIKIAIKDAELPLEDESIFKQPLAVAFIPSDADVSQPVKALYDFRKAKKKLEIKSSLIEGKVLGEEELTAISNLPPREVLLARLVGAVKSPISGLYGVLSGVLRKLVLALKEIEKKKAENA